jgi:hypothetical protein
MDDKANRAARQWTRGRVLSTAASSLPKPAIAQRLT